MEKYIYTRCDLYVLIFASVPISWSVLGFHFGEALLLKDWSRGEIRVRSCDCEWCLPITRIVLRFLGKAWVGWCSSLFWDDKVSLASGRVCGCEGRCITLVDASRVSTTSSISLALNLAVPWSSTLELLVFFGSATVVSVSIRSSATCDMNNTRDGNRHASHSQMSRTGDSATLAQ